MKARAIKDSRYLIILSNCTNKKKKLSNFSRSVITIKTTIVFIYDDVYLFSYFSIISLIYLSTVDTCFELLFLPQKEYCASNENENCRLFTKIYLSS